MQLRPCLLKLWQRAPGRGTPQPRSYLCAAQHCLLGKPVPSPCSFCSVRYARVCEQLEGLCWSAGALGSGNRDAAVLRLLLSGEPADQGGGWGNCSPHVSFHLLWGNSGQPECSRALERLKAKPVVRILMRELRQAQFLALILGPAHVGSYLQKHWGLLDFSEN